MKGSVERICLLFKRDGHGVRSGRVGLVYLCGVEERLELEMMDGYPHLNGLCCVMIWALSALRPWISKLRRELFPLEHHPQRFQTL